jgi:hypothetical protein
LLGQGQWLVRERGLISLVNLHGPKIDCALRAGFRVGNGYRLMMMKRVEFFGSRFVQCGLDGRDDERLLWWSRLLRTGRAG